MGDGESGMADDVLWISTQNALEYVDGIAVVLQLEESPSEELVGFNVSRMLF
jgi:hypothetical protein